MIKPKPYCNAVGLAILRRRITNRFGSTTEGTAPRLSTALCLGHRLAPTRPTRNTSGLRIHPTECQQHLDRWRVVALGFAALRHPASVRQATAVANPGYHLRDYVLMVGRRA